MKKCLSCGKPVQNEKHNFCQDCYNKAHPSPPSSPNKPPVREPFTRGGLPEGYLEDGYFDECQNLRSELITKQAKDIALVFEQTRLTAAALRRFFGKVRSIEQKWDNEQKKKKEEQKKFPAFVPDILELVPFAHNAVTREVVPPIFREFIERNVEWAVKDEKAFKNGFVKHFEYVVAFFPKKK